MRIALLLLLLASQEVRVRVNPLISLAPANITASVHIRPSPDNRYLVMGLSDNFGVISRSDQDLDEKSPSVFNRTFRLGEGNYVFEAVLVRMEKGQPKEYRDRQPFEVR